MSKDLTPLMKEIGYIVNSILDSNIRAVGESDIIYCDCGYAADQEKAENKLVKNENSQELLDIQEVETPNKKSIEEVSSFLNVDPKAVCKSMVYYDIANSKYVLVVVRGDREVNHVKLCNALNTSEHMLELASDEDVERITTAPVGFAGPVKLTKAPVIADKSVMTMHDSVTGGLKKDVHFVHVEPNRDFTPFMVTDVRTVKPGDICPDCGAEFYSKKGNELGHIFKLGDKYTKSMNVTYLDVNGKLQTPIMGCYGIGVDRTLASIIEEHHDEDGIKWTMSTAPYQVVIVPVKYDGAMKENADKIYNELKSCGIDVLLDDRNERPGVKFKDADLIGFPIRIVVGDKNLPNVEVKLRGNPDAQLIPVDEVTKVTSQIVKEELDKLNA